MPSDLSDASTTFKTPMQVTLDVLIGEVIHIYLHDLIMYVNRLSIVSKYQELWLSPFKNVLSPFKNVLSPFKSDCFPTTLTVLT
jgi:hypothetical protein